MQFAWIGITLLAVVLLLFGTGQAALRLGLASDISGRLVSMVAIAVGLWLTTATWLAESGFLAVEDAIPPRPGLLPLTAVVAIFLMSRSTAFTRLSQASPASWPIAAQTFRLLVELALHAEYSAGHIPVQMTWSGRNFDVLTGITAPLVAAWAASGKAPKWALVAWNLLGLALLVNVVGVAVTSFPGPLHLDWPGEPLTAPAHWPFVWLPAFLVPCAFLFHLVSLRQLSGRRE